MSKYIVAVYGSLREGEYNCDSFKSYYPNGFNKIGEAKLPGYKLFTFGPYPFASETEDLEKVLTVDIFDCSHDCFADITRMELGAGYYMKSVNVEDFKGNELIAVIYLQKEDNTYKEIENGDWKTRNDEKED